MLGNMLNIIHSSYITKKHIPDDEEITKVLDRVSKLRYASQPITDKMKKSVLKIVRNYVRLHRGEFNSILDTGVADYIEVVTRILLHCTHEERSKIFSNIKEVEETIQRLVHKI